MNKFLILVVGIILCSIGLAFCIMYLNLFVVGCNIWEYFYYLFKNLDIIYLFGGIGLIFWALKK